LFSFCKPLKIHKGQFQKKESSWLLGHLTIGFVPNKENDIIFEILAALEVKEAFQRLDYECSLLAQRHLDSGQQKLFYLSRIHIYVKAIRQYSSSNL